MYTIFYFRKISSIIKLIFIHKFNSDKSTEENDISEGIIIGSYRNTQIKVVRSAHSHVLILINPYKVLN